MNGSTEQIFSGAGFSSYKNGYVRSRGFHRPNQRVVHLLAVRDNTLEDLRRPVLRIQLLLQIMFQLRQSLQFAVQAFPFRHDPKYGYGAHHDAVFIYRCAACEDLNS